MPGPGVDRLDRRVRAERERRAGVEEAAPRVAGDLGAVAPVAPGRRGVLAQVDRLHGRGDPALREPRAVRRVAQLDVLEAGHERHLSRPSGASTSSAVRTRGVADRVDHRRDAGLGGARRELGEPLRRRRVHPAVVGAPSSGSSSAAVREPSVPSAKSFSQPKLSRPSRRRRPAARRCGARARSRRRGRPRGRRRGCGPAARRPRRARA